MSTVNVDKIDTIEIPQEHTDPEDFAPLTDEDLASIGRGLAEADAGMGMDGEVFLMNFDSE